MKPGEEKVRKDLNTLLEDVKTIEDLKNLEFRIDDYLEEGYNVRDYIPKCNLLAQKFYSKNP